MSMTRRVVPVALRDVPSAVATAPPRPAHVEPVRITHLAEKIGARVIDVPGHNPGSGVVTGATLRAQHVLGGVDDAVHVEPGGHAHAVEHRGQDLGRRVARARAQRAQRPVDLAGSRLVGDQRTGHAQREVLVPVEADL